MVQEEQMQHVLFGLDASSSNDEIRDKVFAKAHEVRYFSLATIPASGNVPGARILDFMQAEADGMIYFGVGTGKTCHADIEKSPVVTLNGSVVNEDSGQSEHRMLISFRISGVVKKAENQKAIEQYWLRNPGSRKMWEKSLDSFCIYCLHAGEGELYQVYRNDRIYRLRFGFGGRSPRPFRYQIMTDLCTGCGECVQTCTASIIEMIDGKAVIPFHHCYECGVCFKTCPYGAVQEFGQSG